MEYLGGYCSDNYAQGKIKTSRRMVILTTPCTTLTCEHEVSSLAVDTDPHKTLENDDDDDNNNNIIRQ